MSTDSLETSTAYARDEEIPFPLASDPDMTAIRAWGVAHRGETLAVPSIFVVEPGGTVVWRRIGENMTDRPDVEQILEALEARGTTG